MCGLSGFNFTDLDLILKMNAVLNHRGPDYQNYYADQNVTLGHVLLSLRGDIKNSLQPYHLIGEDWILLFNGEIYNLNEVAKNLGLVLKQENSDTEFLYLLILKYGKNFIEHIQGMFALALYQISKKTITLYRDTTGQKNIYYYHHANHFFFSSEIKGLCCYPQLNKTLDKDAIEMSTVLGYIPGKDTMFTFIKKLLPGEILRFDCTNNNIKSSFFHNLANQFEIDSPSEVMTQNTLLHLQSSHEISLNLSGGLDSTSILFEATHLDYKVQCFTTGFEVLDPKYKEDQKLAIKMAKDMNQKIEVLSFSKNDYFQLFQEAYGSIEGPNYNMAIPLYYSMAKKIGKSGLGKRVLFSGDGGDELFGGYNYYLSKNIYIDAKIKNFGKTTYNSYRAIKNKFWLNYQEPEARYGEIKFFKSDFGTRIKKKHFQELSKITSHYKEAINTNEDSIYKTMMMDRLIWQSCENFIRNDKIYMANSIETRAPLAYQPLRNYFDKIIPKNSYIDQSNNKIFMRKIYENRLPDYIMHRKNKMGWGVPLGEWFDENSKNFYRNLIATRVKRGSDVINWKNVDKEIQNIKGAMPKELNIYFSIASVMDQFGIES